MNDLFLWIILVVVWLGGFLLALLVITRLDPFWLTCIVDVALTIGLVATLAYIRSWNPDEYEANSELLVVFVMIGVMVLAVFACVMFAEAIGVRL